MTVRPIIDAGPGLNFLSANKERLLIAALGPLSAPETVQSEVLRKSQRLSNDSVSGVVKPGAFSLTPRATLNTKHGGAGPVPLALVMITKVLRSRLADEWPIQLPMPS
jgi:hypothetical protein